MLADEGSEPEYTCSVVVDMVVEDILAVDIDVYYHASHEVVADTVDSAGKGMDCSVASAIRALDSRVLDNPRWMAHAADFVWEAACVAVAGSGGDAGKHVVVGGDHNCLSEEKEEAMSG